MSSYASKPENALRRAEQLISIAQKDQALSVLHNVLSVRRHRTWSPIYETIMITYLDLCLDLNKTREAKDGLHQYRNLAQSQAPGSLEIVIRHLVDTSEALCKAAKEQAESHVNGDAASTKQEETKEESNTSTEESLANESNMLLLSTMSADPAQSQRDTALLLPKIKFTWEAYRAVLDILKSNSKLERLYHITAIGALQFCATYKRRTEFRRLCDLLRIHLGNLQKYGGVAAMAKVEEGGKPNNKVRGWEGWTTESIELHLQTRFSQLETASTLKLYTEGFRTVEDIFNILQTAHSRRKGGSTSTTTSGTPPPPKAKLMAAYYEKLTTLFWVSENYLFHAFAWYKFYTLCKEFNRGMTAEQKTMQASAVVLAALCIPTLPAMTSTASNSNQDKISHTVQDDIAKEKTARMATLLGFHTRNPTREALLAEIRNKNVMGDVPDYICELYTLLEGNVNPLALVQNAKPLLEKLRQEAGAGSTEETKEEEEMNTLSAYVEPLISVLLLKLFHALSASYHTISLDHIKSLTSDLGVSFETVEKIIVTAATSKSNIPLQARIDYRANCLRFGDAMTSISASESSNTKGNVLESNNMRSQLTTLAHQLSTVCNIIQPSDGTMEAQTRATLYSTVRAKVDIEHEEMIARKDLIESRKEEVERQANLKLKEEELKRLEAQANARAEEEKRLAREQLLREQEKLAKIKREMEISEKKNYLTAMGQNVETMTEDELMAFDTVALAKEHAAKAAKKKDDAERKVREMQKKLDYVVRAVRIEEVPIIQKRYEDRVKAEKERYEADIVEQARKTKLAWEADCLEKANLSKFSVFDYMDEFEDLAMVGREAAHQTLCQEEDVRAEEIAEKSKLQRARARKDETVRKQKEEEERIKREAEELKAKQEQEHREEERRKKEEEDALRRKKEEDRMAAERERKARETAPAPPSRDLDKASGGSGGGGSSYVPPSRRGGSGGGGSSHGRSGGSSWADRGRGYGGGRYDGDRSGGGGGGGSRYSDRFGGDRDGGGGGGSRFSDRYGHRGGDRDGGERGGGGGSRFSDRHGGDRGDDRNDSRYGGDRGGDRSYGRRNDDRGGDPPRTNSRWGNSG